MAVGDGDALRVVDEGHVEAEGGPGFGPGRLIVEAGSHSKERCCPTAGTQDARSHIQEANLDAGVIWQLADRGLSASGPCHACLGGSRVEEKAG